MSITRTARQRGLSLIELIVAMVVIGVAVVGVLGAISMSTRASADPMIQKQALAIAEAVLEEVQLMPFTFCDPDHDSAATAASIADCPGANENNLVAEALDIPPTGPAETRAGTERPFDNVNDYNGFNMASISNLSGTTITELAGYAASVTVANQALGAIAAVDSLLITVTVTGPGNTTVVLHGYRTRYAPNALP